MRTLWTVRTNKAKRVATIRYYESGVLTFKMRTLPLSEREWDYIIDKWRSQKEIEAFAKSFLNIQKAP